MVLLAVFSGIGFLIAGGFFIGLLCDKEFKVGLLITVIVFAAALVCGIYFQVYGLRQVKEIVTVYNAYRIDLGYSEIEFKSPVRVKRTITHYPGYTLKNDETLYEVLGSAE